MTRYSRRHRVFFVVAFVELCGQTSSGFGKEAWNGCFRRIYDAAHLAAHPGQTVKSITVLIKPVTGRRSDIDRWWYNKRWIANAKLIFTLRGMKTKYYAYNADCVANAAGLDCPMEEDAGRFTLTRSGAGLTFVVIGDLIMSRAGQDLLDSNVSVRANNSEDRTFVLLEAEADACN